MGECLRQDWYNPSSVYKPSVEAFRRLREARENILKPIHGAGCELIFTSGGTEANNLAVLGAVTRMRGRQIVAVSAVEHPSVGAAFDRLAELGHDVRVIGVDEKGALDWEALEKALDDGASFVSCMQVNNETGALLDAARLHRMVNGRALIHVDGVQGYLRVPFDMKYADLYTLSSHKIHGPKGVGALAVKKGVRLNPRQVGGGQENGLRSGTENTPGIAGLSAAVSAMVKLGPDMPQKLMAKKLRLIEAVRAVVPDVIVNGPEPKDGRAPHREPGLSRRAGRGDAPRAGGRGGLRVHRLGLLVEKAEGQRRADRHGHQAPGGRVGRALFPQPPHHRRRNRICRRQNWYIV